jgi:serine/threonine protein kinase
VVKLADFGVAAKLSEVEAAATQGADAVPAGTPYWMAPEVRAALSWLPPRCWCAWLGVHACLPVEELQGLGA